MMIGINAMIEIGTIDMSSYPYGQVLTINKTIRGNSLQSFILQKLTQRAKRSEAWLKKDVSNFKNKLEFLKEAISNELHCESKLLVHGDYFLNNILIDKDGQISAVLDFSVHTSVGDPRLDAGSIHFLTLHKNITQEDMEYAITLTANHYGGTIQKYIHLYGLYNAIYLLILMNLIPTRIHGASVF